MRRLIKMLVFLYTVYYIVQLILLFFGPGYNINYVIKNSLGNSFLVGEQLKNQKKLNFKAYSLEIKANDNIFTYQLLETNILGQIVISNIQSFNNANYICILPIFKKQNIYFDITCLNNGQYYYYHDLINKDAQLDEFALKMRDYGYDVNHFLDNEQVDSNVDFNLYKNNLIKNHSLSIITNKKVYTLGGNDHQIFSMSIYDDESLDFNKNAIYGFVNDNMVLANAILGNSFDNLIVINQQHNRHMSVPITNISGNTYVQGGFDNKLYFIDRDAKKQYQFDIKNNELLVVGTETSGLKHYNNGAWEIIDIDTALKHNVKFNNFITDVTNEFNNYNQVIKYGTEDSGYYYYFKDVGGKYEVYTSSIKNKDKITYLFTSTIDNIKYYGGYLYFVDGNKLKYYHYNKGLRTLFDNKEMPIIDYNFYDNR